MANREDSAQESIWTDEQEARVLDVGSGYGDLTLPLARARPDLHLVGPDAEAKAVAEATGLAEQLRARRVSFQEGNALAFADSSFELIACQTLLTHVPEPEQVLAEMVRVLKPGGGLLSVEYRHHGVLSAHDDLTPELRLPERLERFRFAQLYIEGKKKLGRGDETVGIRVPFRVQNLGL